MNIPQLFTKTSYSLLKSTLSIEDYVKSAKERGYTSVAITDENVLYGAVEFFQACQRHQVQPIIGLSLEISFEEVYEILLYAKNLAGYQELMRLSSQRMIAESPQKLADYQIVGENIIAVLPQNFPGDLQLLQAVLPNLYQGVLPERMTADNQLPPIALHEVNYLMESDAFAVKVMGCIQAGEQLAKDDLQPLQGEKLLWSSAELAAWFEDNGYQKALTNTKQFVESCQLEIPLGQKLLPHYPVPTKEAAGEYLARLCWQNLSLRVSQVTEVYQRRLAHELEIIHNMGFDDYFLIVWDVMDFVHRQQIVTGAGRGSAAGSLVAYVLRITEVDPIQYDLLFERFLNPERYSMPDIDLDIPDNRRGEVLQYVKEKYGRYHVAQIATFGTMAAKMVLRDVGRVFGLSQSEANRWSKAIPNQLKITLGESFQNSHQLRTLVEQSERSQLLYQTALRLEGLPRHVSTHAAGVVISDQDLMELVPLQNGSEDILLTQFTMTDVEKIGLLKMDFLGLRNLSIIDSALKNIKKIYHQDLDLKKIPLDDAETLALFQRGETSGVFQFESAGIRNVLKKLGPTSIEDIAAVNALYRPGPMQNIDTFVARKKGQEAIDYPEESLRPILENTYGIMVYQEQIMQVAAKMAGFSLGQADILRRAISKKKKAILDEERRHFVEGSLNQGYSQKSAEKVYDYIERFANYGFNRSHAFAYSFVGYQMAYLKVHYPGAFYTALLQAVRGDSKKMREYIAEANKNGVKLLGPDINRSQFNFALVKENQMRFGFDAIKGMRRDFIGNILSSRNQEGHFTSLDQFLLRIEERWLKPDYLEPLILIGAFDELQENRRQLLSELEGKIQNVRYSGGSVDLLEIMSLKQQPLEDFSLGEKLDYEEKYLGFYISGHPTENYPKLKRQLGLKTISEVTVGNNQQLVVYLKEIREIRTKKGEKMAFLTVNDATGEISLTIFPQLYRQIRDQIQLNQVYLIKGKVERSNYDQALQILVEQITEPDPQEAALPNETLFLRIPKAKDTPDIQNQIAAILKQSDGEVPVVLFFEEGRRKIVLDKNFWIGINSPKLVGLRDILGESNVVIR